MNHEIELTTDPLELEHHQDLAWLDENRALFRLAATVAWEQCGRGVLLVELTSHAGEEGQPFTYQSEGARQSADKRLQQLVQIYNPQREFVVALLKPGDRVDSFIGSAPLVGGWEELRTRTPYPTLEP